MFVFVVLLDVDVSFPGVFPRASVTFQRLIIIVIIIIFFGIFVECFGVADLASSIFAFPFRARVRVRRLVLA